MRQRLLIPALSMVMVITTIISGLGTPLMPQMVSHFGVELHEAQWVITMPMLIGAILSPLAGRLGAPARQRRLILASLGLVTLGLLLSTLPLGFGAMLVGRALQGVGLAITPVVLSIARSALGAEAALPAVANLSAAAVAAAGLSYPLSSLFAGLAGINGAYAVGLVLSAATFCLAWYAIPSQRPSAEGSIGQSARVDWLGVFTLAGGSAALLLLLSQLHSWGALTSLLVGLTSAALIVLWVWRSARIANPLIDLRLAAMPNVSQAHISMLLAGAGTYLMLPLAMVVAQDAQGAGLPVIFTGFLLLPYSVMSVAGARMGNWLRRFISLPNLLLIGLLFYIVANAMMALWHANVWVLLLGMTISGIGSGGTFAVIPQLIVQQVPETATASALSFNTLLRYIGFSVGSALVPVLIAAGDAYSGGTDRFTLAFVVAGVFFAVCVLLLLLRRRSVA